jgi:prevent-host-death family protein
MPMRTITVAIGAGRSDLCGLIDRVQSGVQVIFTSHGEPKAVLSAYRTRGKPWRRKADPKLFGDLQSPVMEDWS